MRRVTARSGVMDNGMLVSPGEIIARAAATVPERLPGDPPADASSRAQRGDGDTIVIAPARPNRRARRRPKDVARHAWFYASRGTVAVALLGAAVGGPIWLFSSGAAETAQRKAEATYASLRRAAGVVQLDTLTVEGRNRTSREALRAALQIKKGDSLFASDPWSIKRRLEALPWVRTASVERRFPHSLVVKITERNPMARFRSRDGMVLVDDEGAIIPVAPGKELDNLILLEGEGAPEHAAALLKLLDREPGLARRAVSATRQGQRRWDITFDSGAILRLPDGYERAAVAKFGEFERQHALLSRGAVTYDMRLPDRLTVRNPNNTAPAAAPAPPEKPAAGKKPKKAG